MKAELVVNAIVELGRSDEKALPAALQNLAVSLGYKHAAIVEAVRKNKVWQPVRTICQSQEFRRACKAVLGPICDSEEPVEMFKTAGKSELTESVRETNTNSAAGIQLQQMSTADKKSVLLLVSDDPEATLSDVEKRLLATVGTLVCKGLEHQELTLDAEEPKLSDSIGIVTHDLRNPVGTILGYTDLLLANKGANEFDDETRNAIGRIRENSIYVLQLISDLMDSVSLDAGRLELYTMACSLGEVVLAALDRCSMAARKKSITLKSDLPPERLRVLVDHRKVGQILDNLITNAIKFSHAGTQVTVGGRQAGNFVEAWVQDQGQGIPRDEVPNLFKKFSRTSTRSTAGEKSTGLGLFIVNELVRLHGGTIVVDTSPEGSRFTFTLPSAPPKPE